MSLRQYANAPATTLSSPCTALATNIDVVSITGLPITYPFILILDRGTASEEVVLCTAGTGTSLTVTRGYDSTTAFSHGVGASVEHGISAIDAREANAHVNATSGAHGVAGGLVGTTDTQTLTGKTLSTDSNTINGLPASSFAVSDGTGKLDGGAAVKAIPAGAVVGTSDAQALTNKDLTGAGNTFPASLATAASVTTHTGAASGVHGVAGAVVGTTDTQTLTNKTLTSPTITGVGEVKRAIKTAEEAINNSASPHNDNHLSFTLTPGTWIFDLVLYPTHDNDNTSDLKVQFSFTGTSTDFIAGELGPEQGSTAVSNSGLRASTVNALNTNLVSGVVLAVTNSLFIKGSIVVTATGDFKLQWSQNIASPVTTTTLQKGSWMRAERVI